MNEPTHSRPSPLGWLAAALLLLTASCGSTVQNRSPLGERFPQVEGRSLDGTAQALPPGEPTVLLLGYVQDAQFDADRWLIGLLQAGPGLGILEVPTIPGLFPRLLSGKIDEGMRGGIPSEDWQSVVTVWGADADRLIAFTGNERPRNMRVLLLDAQGRVRWFHDRGFSAAKLLELAAAARELGTRSDE